MRDFDSDMRQANKLEFRAQQIKDVTHARAIKQANALKHRAQRIRVAAYAYVIQRDVKNAYRCLDEETRGKVDLHLKSLFQLVDHGIKIYNDKVKSVPKIIPKIFNPKQAKEIREKVLGYSQKELGEHLGLSQSKISRCETGRYLLNTEPSNNEGVLEYLKWLKENGYNPFNINS